MIRKYQVFPILSATVRVITQVLIEGSNHRKSIFFELGGSSGLLLANLLYHGIASEGDGAPCLDELQNCVSLGGEID